MMEQVLPLVSSDPEKKPLPVQMPVLVNQPQREEKLGGNLESSQQGEEEGEELQLEEEREEVDQPEEEAMEA